MAHKGSTRIAIYPITEIFDFIKANPDGEKVEYYEKEIDGVIVKAKLRRARIMYEKGIKCVKCPLEGSYFVLDKWLDGSLHLDLYAVNEKEEEVLMTIDHIKPRLYNRKPSERGPNTIANKQTMCEPCNIAKGNKIES